MKTFAVLIIISLALAAANEPSAPLWLQGTWRNDPDRTKEEAMRLLNKPIDQTQTQQAIWACAEKRVNLAADLQNDVIGPFDLVVMAHQVSIIGHYVRQTDRFTVSKISSDRCTLRFEDGFVQTYYRDGPEIFVYSDHSNLKIYSRRLP